MDTILFWFFSALFFVQKNWFLIFKILWFSWGIYQVPGFYKDSIKQMNEPTLASRIGKMFWIVKPMLFIVSIIFVVVYPAGRILGLLFFRNKKG